MSIEYAYQNSTYERRTADNRFGITITDEDLSRILDLCVSVGLMEVGGILVGYYSYELNNAIVTNLSDYPQDSKISRNSFYRGIEGLQTWLNNLWKKDKREYYLGEWHFHPNRPAHPSGIDISQMQGISRSNNYQCPEPILLIIGGIPQNEIQICSYVFPIGEQHMEMTENG